MAAHRAQQISAGHRARSQASEQLYGTTTSGEYTGDIYVGGRPYRVIVSTHQITDQWTHRLVQVDTGSPDFAIAGSSCNSCDEATQRYTPKQYLSCGDPRCSLCNNNRCATTMSYGDGSTLQADVALDTVQLAGHSADVTL